MAEDELIPEIEIPKGITTSASGHRGRTPHKVFKVTFGWIATIILEDVGLVTVEGKHHCPSAVTDKNSAESIYELLKTLTEMPAEAAEIFEETETAAVTDGHASNIRAEKLRPLTFQDMTSMSTCAGGC